MTRTVTYAEFVPVLRELQEQGRPIYQVACVDQGYRISFGVSAEEKGLQTENEPATLDL